MKIDDLKVFVQVADAGSLSLAAAQLGLAQPNVSRTVRRLEDGLKIDLFQRTGRGVALTRSGERFLTFARDTVDGLERTEGDIRRLAGAPPRQLTIVIPRHTGRLLMPAIFRGFSAELPNVQLDIVEMQSRDASTALVEKSCDIAVFYDTTQSAFPDRHALFRESLYLTGHENHLGDNGDPIPLADCGSLPLLVFSNPPYAQMIESAFETANVPMKDVRYFDNKVAMIAYAMEGQGVAIQAFSNFVNEYENGEIRARKLVNPEIGRNVMGAVGLHMDRNFARRALALLKSSLAGIATVARWAPCE